MHVAVVLAGLVRLELHRDDVGVAVWRDLPHVHIVPDAGITASRRSIGQPRAVLLRRVWQRQMQKPVRREQLLHMQHIPMRVVQGNGAGEAGSDRQPGDDRLQVVRVAHPLSKQRIRNHEPRRRLHHQRSLNGADSTGQQYHLQRCGVARVESHGLERARQEMHALVHRVCQVARRWYTPNHTSLRAPRPHGSEGHRQVARCPHVRQLHIPNRRDAHRLPPEIQRRGCEPQQHTLPIPSISSHDRNIVRGQRSDRRRRRCHRSRRRRRRWRNSLLPALAMRAWAWGRWRRRRRRRPCPHSSGRVPREGRGRCSSGACCSG